MDISGRRKREPHPEHYPKHHPNDKNHKTENTNDSLKANYPIRPNTAMEFLHLFRINLQSTTSRKPDNITVLPTEHIIPAVSIKTSYYRHEITPPVLSTDFSLQAEPVPEPSLYPWPERPSSSTANLVRASPVRLFSSRTPTETGTVMTTNGMNPGYEIGEKTNPHTSLLGNPKQPAILTCLFNE